MIERTYTSYWKPSLTDGDVAHLKALELVGATIKGNPSRSHLKKAGAAKALCGARPGISKGTRRMRDRTGWYVYQTYEHPGCKPCEACLKAAEAADAVAEVSMAEGVRPSCEAADAAITELQQALSAPSGGQRE